MPTFSLITEGHTDQAILEAVLYGYYDNEVEITIAQPIRDATDESRAPEHFGGWEKVLEFCTLEAFEQAFIFNDYVIIQLDTDCGEHVNFGVPLTANGADRAVLDIVKDVQTVLVSKVSTQIYEKYQDRILFAIAVHSSECWLLPLYMKQNANKERTKNCEQHLVRATQQANVEYEKNYRGYERLAKPLLKKKNIELVRHANLSFDYFVSTLRA